MEASHVLQVVARTARLSASDARADRLLLLHDRGQGSRPDVGQRGAEGDFYDVAGDRTFDLPRSFSVLAARTPGALLIHGALATKDGIGVLLAGPGGRGKTTSSKRLPAPWQAQSDDAALVLRNPQGRHVAHPWPTWSRLLWEQSTETWDVQRSLPLGHVFFLSWADHDAVERVGCAQALCLVLESVEQLGSYLPPEYRSAAQRLKAFESATDLVKSVPVSILHISPDGPFWLAIERALDARL